MAKSRKRKREELCPECGQEINSDEEKQKEIEYGYKSLLINKNDAIAVLFGVRCKCEKRIVIRLTVSEGTELHCWECHRTYEVQIDRDEERLNLVEIPTPLFKYDKRCWLCPYFDEETCTNRDEKCEKLDKMNEAIDRWYDE